jgi:hypothetical protein
VATLYDATPDGEQGFCLRYPTNELASGTYYVRVQSASMARAMKMQVVR